MSIAGRWNVTMQTPVGTLRFTWDFTNEAGQWRGRMFGQPPVGDSELTAVQLCGESLSFETTAQSPVGALQLAFVGTVGDATLTGVCKSKFGDHAFAAARA
jgi:hypothetical protein